MSHKTVGNRVRELREAKGWTQAQLAEKVGVARQSIISIEKGRFLPTIETALGIRAALEHPLEDIFWLKDETS